MKNEIVKMYHNIIIKRIDKQFFKNEFESKKEKKEFEALYLRTLRTIEDLANADSKIKK